MPVLAQGVDRHRSTGTNQPPPSPMYSSMTGGQLARTFARSEEVVPFLTSVWITACICCTARSASS